MSTTEQDAMRSVLPLAGPKGRLATQVMDLGNGTRHSLKLITPGGPALAFALPTSTHVFTAALGVSLSRYYLLGGTMGGGVYGSNKPETGTYLNYGGGVFLNVGGSLGGQLTWIFGPPSTFAGVCWGVGISVDVLPVCPFGISVGGHAWFNLAYRPHAVFTLIGFSYDLAVGVGILPVTFSLEQSRTRTFPHGRGAGGAGRPAAGHAGAGHR
jgi:hypothetical protein